MSSDSPQPSSVPPSSTPASREASDEDARFGRTLIRERILPAELIKTAIRTQQVMREEGVTLRLGEVLVRQGHLTPDQVRQILALQQKTLLTCLKCHKNFNVKNWHPGIEVFCPKCSTALVPPKTDQTIEAHESHPGAPSVGTDATREPAGGVLGRYRLLQKLGEGGMGIVWKAWDTELKRVVALKEIKTGASGASPEVLARFQQEARSAGKLRHPGIVQVHDVGEIGGRHFFTMDYVQGISLEKALGTASAEHSDAPGRGHLTHRRSLEIVGAAAEALHYAHEQGIVHRDVKPANIMLEIEEGGRPFHGRVLLTDFGLAKDVSANVASGLTVSGAIMGTPLYMSPEQAAGRHKEIGPKSDLFSLGVVLYQMVTGRPPFDGETLLALLEQITRQDPAPPTQVAKRLHRDVEAICLKALEKEPARRYESARALAEDIHRYLEGEPIEARPLGMSERLARKARQHKIPLTAAGIVVAVVLGAFGFNRFQSTRAARDVAEARTEAEKEKTQYREEIQRIAQGIDQLTTARDYGRARAAYEEMLKATTDQAQRGSIAGKIEDTASLQKLHENLAAAMGTALKEHETLRLRDGKSLQVRVLLADSQKIVVYADERSLEIPWGKISDEEYRRLLGEYLPDPDAEMRYSLGVFALSMKDAAWAKDCFLKARTDPGLMTRAAAHLKEMGVETGEARQETVQEERGRRTEREAQDALQRFRVETALLAKQRRYEDAIQKCRSAESNPLLASGLESIQGQRIWIEGARSAWDRRVDGLKGRIGQTLRLERKPKPIEGRIAEVDERGTVTLVLDERSKATSRLRWDELPESERIEAVEAGSGGAPAAAVELASYWLTQEETGRASASLEKAGTLPPLARSLGLRLAEADLLFERDGSFLTRSEVARRGLFARRGVALSAEDLRRLGAFGREGRAYDEEEMRAAGLFGREGLALTLEELGAQSLFGRDGRAYTVEELGPHGFFGRGVRAYSVEDLKQAGLFGRDAAAFDDFEIREQGLYGKDGLAYTGAEVRSKGWSAFSGRALDAQEDLGWWRENYAGKLPAYTIHSKANLLQLVGIHGSKKWWHGARVNDVAFHPDGRRAFSCGDDGRVCVWDLETGKRLKSWSGSRFALFPDGRRAVTGNADYSIGLWDVEEEKLLATWKGHEGQIWRVGVSPDGKKVASCSTDKSIRIWDVESGKETARLMGHTDKVFALAFSPDGRFLASGGADNTVRVWDLESSKERGILLKFRAQVYTVGFISEGRQVISGSDEEVVKVGEIESMREVGSWPWHNCDVFALAVSPDGGRVITGSSDGTARVWDPLTGSAVAVFKGHRDWVQAVAISPDGRRALTGSRDGSIRYWESETGVELSRVEQDFCDQTPLTLSKDGKKMFTAGLDGNIEVWDLGTSCRESAWGAFSGGVTAFVPHPDGRRLLCAAADGSLGIWDLATHRPVAKWTGHPGIVRSMDISKDGTRAVTCGADDKVRVWDVEAGRITAACEGHTAEVIVVSLGPDGRTVASGSLDMGARLWDAEPVKRRLELSKQYLAVESIAFAEDGRRLFTGSRGASVCGWNLSDGKRDLNLEGYGRRVRALASLDNGGRLLVGSSGAWIDLWNTKVDSPQGTRKLAVWRDLPAGVTALVASADGKQAYAACQDKSILRLDIDKGPPATLIRGRLSGAVAKALSPDGKYELVANGTSLVLRDPTTAKEIRSWNADLGAIGGIAFDRDGVRAFSCGGSGAIYMWEIPGGKALDTIHTDGFPQYLEVRGDHLYAMMQDLTVCVYWIR